MYKRLEDSAQDPWRAQVNVSQVEETKCWKNCIRGMGNLAPRYRQMVNEKNATPRRFPQRMRRHMGRMEIADMAEMKSVICQYVVKNGMWKWRSGNMNGTIIFTPKIRNLVRW